MPIFTFRQNKLSKLAIGAVSPAGSTISLAILAAALTATTPVVHAADYTVTTRGVYLEPTRCRNVTRLSHVSGNGEYISYYRSLWDFYGTICTWPDDPPPPNNPAQIHVENLATGEISQLTPDSRLPGVVAKSVVHSDDNRYIRFTGSHSETQTSALYLKDTELDTITKIYDDYPDGARFHSNGTQILFQDYIEKVAYDFVYDIPTATLNRNKRTGKFYGVTWAYANERYPRDPYRWYVHTDNDKESALYYRQLDNIVYNLDITTNTETVVDTTLDGRVPEKIESIYRSKNGRYAVWSGDFLIDGGPKLEEIYVHHDLQTNRKIVVDKAQWASSVRLSGNGRYVAFSQDINRLDDDLPPYTYPFDGIALFDSVTGETEILQRDVCENGAHSFDPNSCQNTGWVLSVSDDGLTIGYGGWTGAALLQVEVNPDNNAYTDVPADFWARDAIERFDQAGIAGECQSSPRAFCPLRGVRHDVSAKWLVKAIKGSDYVPATGTGSRFTDVPSDWWAVDWIEEIDRLKVDRGYGATFRPTRIITRAQFAYLLAKAKYGVDYSPSTPTGEVFVDVLASHWAAPYIEDLQRDGFVASGCDGNENTFCPGQPLTRAMAADMIVKAFDL